MAQYKNNPQWLHTIGQIAGTFLVIELLAILFVILIIAVALAAASWYLKNRVMPIVNEYSAKATQAMQTADRGTARVAQGVAELHGRARSVETIIRVLLFGRKGAEGLPAVPVGTAQQGARVVQGMGGVEGYAPQDMPVNPDLSTRDLTAADVTPLTTTGASTARTEPHVRQPSRNIPHELTRPIAPDTPETTRRGPPRRAEDAPGEVLRGERGWIIRPDTPEVNERYARRNSYEVDSDRDGHDPHHDHHGHNGHNGHNGNTGHDRH